MKPMRWSRQPSERGLARVCQTPRGFDLKRDGKIIATVRPRCDRFKILDWYWSGLDGQNSLRAGVFYPDAESAKKAARKAALELDARLNMRGAR